MSIDLVGKIGSMALIRRADRDIDYNIFSRLGAELRPGMVWVSSGAVEIGRIDYEKRHQHALSGPTEDIKTDYAAQGQSILMENYRRYISPAYSVRQVLVEHQHFNNAVKREHIAAMLERASEQGAIPIVNYNDPVSIEETRKMELSSLRSHGSDVVECVDNDETAAVIARITHAKLLLLLTSVDGIYLDPADSSTRVDTITGGTIEETTEAVRRMQTHCRGASRELAAGAFSKLEYALEAASNGCTVIIGNAKYKISELLSGHAPCTRVGVGL